ncbi:MAG: peptidoglycan DD-metalloendopeptidase family protein [Bacteroidetes bacterium]|nr:peptidoglycan DD-metalloendopeptidase family protein [Bacteroidota bacterium]
MTARQFKLLRLANSKLLFAVLLLLTLALVAAPVVYAQKKSSKKKTTAKKETSSKSTLQQKKQKLQSDIDFTNKLLSETRQNKKLSLSQLAALNQKIEAREGLINTISGEISEIEQQIGQRQQNIRQLTKTDSILREEYKQMIQFAWRNRNANQRMMFLFTAGSFNQAYKRMIYLRQLNLRRKAKAEEIAGNREALNEEVVTLDTERGEKKSLLDNESKEKEQLAGEKEEKQKTFLSLQEKEKQLKDDLDKKKKQAAQTDAAIQNLIAAEAARAAEKARKEAEKKAAQKKADPVVKTDPKTGNTGNSGNSKPAETPTAKAEPAKIEISPEEKIVGNSFLNNKGSLPWPVAQGTIIEHFGTHPHPVLAKVMVNNNGVDIATTRGAQARSVFDGEVTGITNIPGAGWLVIVRHGEYLSVYANLSSVSVKTGDKVKTKQAIGNVAENDEGQPVLHFEVWKSGVGKMDPEGWIARKG